jgi:hypothetical protein
MPVPVGLILVSLLAPAVARGQPPPAAEAASAAEAPVHLGQEFGDPHAVGCASPAV